MKTFSLEKKMEFFSRFLSASIRVWLIFSNLEERANNERVELKLTRKFHKTKEKLSWVECSRRRRWRIKKLQHLVIQIITLWSASWFPCLRWGGRGLNGVMRRVSIQSRVLLFFNFFSRFGHCCEVSFLSPSFQETTDWLPSRCLITILLRHYNENLKPNVVLNLFRAPENEKKWRVGNILECCTCNFLTVWQGCVFNVFRKL